MMQVSNPVLILAFIPIFDYIIYPILSKFYFDTTVLFNWNFMPVNKYYGYRVILGKKTYLKSAAMLFTKQKEIIP